MDDRHARPTSRTDLLVTGPDEAATVTPLRSSDWPAHPWVGLVERSGRDPVPGGRGEACRLVVIWWGTAASAQPVVLRVRVRLE